MRPIRSDDTDFSTPLSPSAKRGSLSHSQALALTIRARDVAGDAIALPEFWSASGACSIVFTTPSVPLVGDRNLKGWLRVLTQQSCDCLSPSGRLYGYSHAPHTCKKFYHLLNPSSTSCLIRFAISNWPSRTIT